MDKDEENTIDQSENGNADETATEGNTAPEEPTAVLDAIAKLTEQLTALDSKIEAVKVSNADLIKKGLVINDGKGNTTPEPNEDYKTLDQLDYSM